MKDCFMKDCYIGNVMGNIYFEKCCCCNDDYLKFVIIY